MPVRSARIASCRQRRLVGRRPAVGALGLCAALLAGCAAQVEDSAAAEDAPAARVVGEPVDCIQASVLQRSLVRSDRTIDFEMRNRDLYRNTLPNRCPSLGFEKRIAYELRIGRLCSTDLVRVLHAGGARGPACGLGPFVPVELVEPAG